MNLLENITSPEKFFYCTDGSVLRSIRELGQKLETISSQAFSSHVNSQKNDFHNWVRDVFQDNELAGELLNARTSQQAAAVVRRRMQKLLGARKEIESAISKVLEKPIMPAAAKPFCSQRFAKSTSRGKLDGATFAKAKRGFTKNAAKTKAQNLKRKKAGKAENKAENRKLNKKKNKKPESKTFSGKRSGKKRHIMKNRRKSTRTKPKLRQLKAHVKNKMKKQVSNWLKWLSISPKM